MWPKYCAAVGVDLGIHQLRPAHATELINSGVFIEAVRRRIGHASTETTQIYASWPARSPTPRSARHGASGTALASERTGSAAGRRARVVKPTSFNSG